MGGLMLSYPDSGELDFGENPILGNNFERTYAVNQKSKKSFLLLYYFDDGLFFNL